MDYTMQVTEIQSQMPAGLSWGVIIVWLILYVFFALCLAMVAKKTGRKFGSSFIMALIPIANIILVLQMGKKPWWWVFLMLIPIVNIVLWILAWMGVAETRGKPGWWGIIIVLVPILNIIFFLILAFGKEAGAPAASAA